VTIRTNARAVESSARRGNHRRTYRGDGISSTVRARRECAGRGGSNGIPFWCSIPARPMHGPVSRRTTPATVCVWPWRTAPTCQHGRGVVGSDCADPGRHHRSKQRSRSVRLERTRPGASSSTRPGSASSTRLAITTRWPRFPLPRPRGGYVNDRGWMVFDSFTCSATDFWASLRGNRAGLVLRIRGSCRVGAKTGIDAKGLTHTIDAWNRHVATVLIPTSGGFRAYDGYWGTTVRPLPPAGHWSDRHRPYYACRVVGAMAPRGTTHRS